ncbi:MAG: hypothetical protein R3C61_22985 [Bacteroidia bacterium]
MEIYSRIGEPDSAGYFDSEIATSNRRHGIGWILYDTYHISIVMMLVLPVFFLKRPWPGLVLVMAVGTVFSAFGYSHSPV